MTTVDSSALHARRCAVSTCAYWTNHESGVCPRCRERGLGQPATLTAPDNHDANRALPVPDLDLLEADVQRACIETLELCGWKVYRVGQYNAERTQDAGVSDLIALKPGEGVVFVEVKRSRGGVQSEEQRMFEFACRAAGVPYILTNDAHHLFATLVELKRGKNG
jgi:Holliday junction resolvase